MGLELRRDGSVTATLNTSHTAGNNNVDSLQRPALYRNVRSCNKITRQYDLQRNIIK